MKRFIVLLSIAILAMSHFGGAWAKTQGGPRNGILVYSLRAQTGNNWEVWQDNRGQDIAPMPGSQPGGFWPKGSGRNYIFGGGMWVGTIDTTRGFEDTLVTVGYQPASGGGVFGPCSPNGDDSTGERDPLARVYLSTDPLDRAQWPVRDSLGRPVFKSMQDAWTIYNDVDTQYFWGHDKPIGIQVIRTAYAWQFAGFSDILLYSFEVKNVTRRVPRYQPNGITLRRVILAMCVDADIGNESGTNANDLTMLDNSKYRRMAGDTVSRNLAIQYQLTPEGGWGIPPPYSVGFRFLEGPNNNTGQTIQIRSQPGIGYPEYDRDVLPDSLLGMTAFQLFTISTDPSTPGQRYLELSGRYYLTPDIYNAYQYDNLGPGDKRFIQCSGPFNIPVDSTVRFVVAVIGGSDTAGIRAASDRAQDIYDNWSNIRGEWVQVSSPNGGEILSGSVPIVWTSNGTAGDSVDLYLTRDGGSTWDTLAMNQPNNGTYLWDTTRRPDGTRYLVALYLHNDSIASWDCSDSLFTVNNPGNFPPEVELRAPVGGEIWGGTQNVRWFALDPDGDSLEVNLRYSWDGKQTWQDIATGVPNTGIYSWDTRNFRNSHQCFAAVTAWDGQALTGDTSFIAFMLDNVHPPAGPVSHDSGGATTVVVNPYVVDPPRVTGHRYRIRFLPIGRVNDTTALYSYDMWDLNTGQRVITNRVTSVAQINIPIIDNAPVVDGLEVETRHQVNLWNFHSGTVTVQPPYSEPVIADTAVTPFQSTPRYGFRVKCWPFRGTLFKLTWHKRRGTVRGDSIWVDVRDSTNHVNVPPETLAVQDSAKISGWCFGGNGVFVRGKLWIDSTMVSIVGNVDTIAVPARYPGTWLTLCGRRYWFAGKQGGFDGRPMRWAAGVCPINEGDVWLVYSSGDRPPHDGDVYTFQTVGVEEVFSAGHFAFSLGQAYPNPAREGNMIPFSLEKKGRTSLKVYNVTGALVRTLVDGEMGAGRYQAAWDGRNDRGRQTASGVYLYRLEAPGKAAVKKMVVIR